MLVGRCALADMGGSWNLTDDLRVLVVRAVDDALVVVDRSEIGDGGDGSMVAAIVAAFSLSLQTSLSIALSMFASAVLIALSIFWYKEVCVGRTSADASVRNLALSSTTLCLYS